MRQDRFPEMDDDSLEQRLAPLLAAARLEDAPWLRKLLTDREVAKAFGALDSELFVRGALPAHAVAVTSAARAEGRTTLALVLAAMTAAFDRTKRVLLVDGDIENGRLGAMFQLGSEAAGLADLFAGRAGPAQIIHASALANLSVAPSARPGTKVLGFAPKPFEGFLEEARSRFDLVVVDTPAGSASKAAFSIAKLVGHAILVVRYAGPTREQVGTFLADLERAGAEVIGCVMNRREYAIPSIFYGHR